MENHLFHWFGLCSGQSEALGFFQRLVETSDSLQYRILKWYYHRSIHFGWDATWGTAFWRRGESEGTGVRVTTGEGGGVGGGASSRGGGGTSSSRGGEAGAGGGLLGSSLLVFLVRKLIFLNTPRKDFFLVFSSSLAFKSTWTFWASNWLLSWKEGIKQTGAGKRRNLSLLQQSLFLICQTCSESEDGEEVSSMIICGERWSSICYTSMTMTMIMTMTNGHWSWDLTHLKLSSLLTSMTRLIRRLLAEAESILNMNMIIRMITPRMMLIMIKDDPVYLKL